MKITHVLAAGVAASAAIGVWQAGATDISSELNTYEIHGSNVADLRSAVIAAAKTLGNGSHGAASATFAFKPEVSYVAVASGCKLRNVRVMLDIAVTLPEWVSHRGADEETVAAWRRFDRYLKAHEERHIAIAIAHRERMVTALNAIGTKDDCQAVGRKAVAVVADVERRHDEAQQAFDRAERDRSSLLGR